MGRFFSSIVAVHPSAIASLLLLVSGPAVAQDSGPVAESSPVRLVASVSFVGNTLFTDYELSLRVRTKPNREFLGIPGFRWWLGIYRLGDSGKLGKRLGGALKASGEPPAELIPDVVAADVERLRVFYQQEGFRDVFVSTRYSKSDSVWTDVTFVIDEGAPTFIRYLDYEGIDGLPAKLQAALVGDTDLNGTASPGERRFLASGERYSEPRLLAERRRILNLLHNNGYAASSRDSIRAIVIPFRKDSFDVKFQIGPGARHKIGDVHFVVTGPDSDLSPRFDTLFVRDAGSVTSEFSSEARLKSRLLQRALRVEPGENYDESEILDTKRRLEATGVFAFTNVDSQLQDTSSGVPTIRQVFDLRTRRRHRMRYEWFMLQRGGVLGGADAELGMGIGVVYRNANLLGSGEALSIRASGSIAADSDFKLFTSTQGELSVSVDYPYLISPFRGLENRLSLYDVGTRLSINLLTARRDQLKLIIRGQGSARFRLDMHHSPTITSFVDVIDVSVSNPDTLAGFAADFLDPLLASIEDDPVQRARIIEDYTQPQVNDALRYTLRSERVNPLRREEGYSYEASVEVGGSIMTLLDRFAFTPGAIEGTLPGLPFFRQDGSPQRLIYRPYVRIRTDLRQYRKLSPRRVLAWKTIVGFSQPTGRSDVVPFDRRFFSGGAFSVRGWGIGQLGPGAASLVGDAAQQTETTNLLGGDVKLEGSVELRNIVFRNVLAAQWIGTVFADAGNVWFGPSNPGFDTAETGGPSGKFNFGTVYREIGVGSGIGLRVAWEYLIIRFDLAYKVYDPSQRNDGILPEGLRRPVLHFGIGHAF